MNVSDLLNILRLLLLASMENMYSALIFILNSLKSEIFPDKSEADFVCQLSFQHQWDNMTKGVMLHLILSYLD